MFRLGGRFYIIAAVALLAAMALYLSTAPQGRVLAQGSMPQVPDLVGDWVGGAFGGCEFDDVWDKNGPSGPECAESPSGAAISITHQTGRAFAGKWLCT